MRVVLQFLMQVLRSFNTQAMMMPALHRALQPQRNQQTNGDGEQVQQEVAKAVDLLFWRMDLDHGKQTSRLNDIG